MNFIYSVIGYPLGWIMWACYKVVSNYGIALILFTVITRLLLLPTAVKQQKSTVKMALFRPKMEEIQKKYANNKEKMNEELQKLYQTEGYNPMSGCLPLLIQFPILFGLIDVIYNPLKHILRLPADVIQKAMDAMQALAGAAVKNNYSAQISLIGSMKSNPEAFVSAVGQDVVNQVQGLDLSFFGLNLTQTPTFAFNLLLIVPILAGVSSLLVSAVTMKNTRATGGDAMANTNASMMIMMTAMTVWFTFSTPAGVGFYWIVSNVIMIGQSLLLNKFYNPAEIAEKLKVEEEARKEREREEKIEAKRRAKEGDATAAATALSQKEINRQKLAAARKRDAEKYGEEYVEVQDKDLD